MTPFRAALLAGAYRAPVACDPSFSNVVLLVGADTSVADESSKAHTVTTVAPAFRNTTSPKFGTGCLDPNNTGRFTCANHADFQFGSGDFTVELWRKATVDDQVIRLGSVTGSDRSWYLNVVSGALWCYLSAGGSSFETTMTTGSNVLNDGVWHHLVLERSGTVLRKYIDGAMVQKVTGYVASLFNSTGLLTIGDGLTGQLDEIRITKGTARYNSDAGFTVPTAAYPRGACTLWTPANLTSLYAWYDPQQQTEADSANLVSLVDQSGNGRHFTGGSGPPLKHNFVNGKKVIDCQGNALTQDTAFLTGLTAGSLFMVLKAKADPASSSTHDGAPFGNCNNHGSQNTHMPFTDGSVYSGFLSNTRRSVNPVLPLTDWHIWSEHSAPNDFAMWMNGSTILTSSSNTVGVKTATRWFGEGGAASALNNYAGYVGDAVFTNAKLSTDDRQKLEGYLAHKYGLAATLPSGHPYLTAPPTL